MKLREDYRWQVATVLLLMSPLEFSPTPDKRARIYNPDGVLVFDSRKHGDVLRSNVKRPERQPGFLERAYAWVGTWISRRTLSLYRELPPENGLGYPEVGDALRHIESGMLRVNERGEVLVLVAMPVTLPLQHGKDSQAVTYALMLTTEDAGSENRRGAARLGITAFFSFVTMIALVVSWLAIRQLMRDIVSPSKRPKAFDTASQRVTG